MPSDFTHMLNLGNKTNQQQKSLTIRLLNIENKLVVVIGRQGWVGEIGKEDEEYYTYLDEH